MVNLNSDTVYNLMENFCGYDCFDLVTLVMMEKCGFEVIKLL